MCVPPVVSYFASFGYVHRQKLEGAVEADDRPLVYLLCAHLMGDAQAAVLNHILGPQGTVLHVACQRGSLFAAQLFLWVCAPKAWYAFTLHSVWICVLVISDPKAWHVHLIQWLCRWALIGR